MSALWRWLPGKAIGPFTFGSPIGLYVQDYGLRKRRRDCAIADWEIYEFPGFESWVVVEKGQIVEVHCVDEVEYSGRDLIGMPSPDIRELLGQEDKREENVGFGYALSYDKLGLTIFVVNDAVSAAACGLILPDDPSSETASSPMTHPERDPEKRPG